MLFEVMGMCPDDTLDDLFPGSGAVSVAWETWKSGGPLPKQRRDEAVLPSSEEKKT